MSPHDAEDSLRLLFVLTDMENRLTIHFGRMDLRRCRANGKVLHEHGSSNLPAKDPAPIPQIIDRAFSLPTHGRMARFDGFCLGPTEETHAHDE